MRLATSSSVQIISNLQPNILPMPARGNTDPHDPTPTPTGGGAAARRGLRIHCPRDPQPIAVGLDLWACWGPIDEDDNPASAVSVANGLDVTAAERMAEGLALTPGEFAGASEFRAWDGRGELRVRREVMAA